MSLAAELARLEASGLLRLARARPEVEYAFQHALVQDAAYASLLRQDRRRLHRLAASVLERSYADRPKELAPILAHHYDEAGESAQALHYYRLAAEQAASGYALHEAIGHLDRVVEIAGALGEPTFAPLRERGRIRDLVGDFDAAAADLEAAVEAARAHESTLAECEALIELGLLWAARDYARSGEYLDRALALARQAGDQRTLARTLNRVANWRVNADNPRGALPLHAEALATFRELSERRGEAETLDLLGMCHFMAGDASSSLRVYEEAIPLLRELDDRFRLVSSLITHAFRAGGYFVDAGGVPTSSPAEAEPQLHEALAIAAAAGMRSAECYGRTVLGMLLTTSGQYRRADQAFEQALATATALNHRQWIVSALCGRAIQLLDLLLPDHATPVLERAVNLARDTGSTYWLRVCSATLAEALAKTGRATDAEAVLSATAFDFGPPPWSLAQRMLWHARAHVHLAGNEPAEANRIMERLQQAGSIGPYLTLTRTAALIALGRFEEARPLVDEGVIFTRGHGSLPLTWRFLAQSAIVSKRLGVDVGATTALESARSIVQELASEIADQEQRALFRTRATAQLDT